MVNVVDYGCQFQILGCGLAMNPAWNQHPGVQGRANNGTSVDEAFDLPIGELTITRNQGPAVVVTGQDWSAKVVKRLVKMKQ